MRVCVSVSGLLCASIVCVCMCGWVGSVGVVRACCVHVGVVFECCEPVYM